MSVLYILALRFAFLSNALRSYLTLCTLGLFGPVSLFVLVSHALRSCLTFRACVSRFTLVSHALHSCLTLCTHISHLRSCFTICSVFSHFLYARILRSCLALSTVPRKSRKLVCLFVCLSVCLSCELPIFNYSNFPILLVK